MSDGAVPSVVDELARIPPLGRRQKARVKALKEKRGFEAAIRVAKGLTAWLRHADKELMERRA